jgi:hypothetical protein
MYRIQVTVSGDQRARDLARLCIGITLMQRNGGEISVDFGGLEEREDTVTADVPVTTAFS